jgi:hypothetical protein
VEAGKEGAQKSVRLLSSIIQPGLPKGWRFGDRKSYRGEQQTDLVLIGAGLVLLGIHIAAKL